MICRVLIKTEDGLDKMMEKMGTGYPCILCPKVFKYPTNLRRHVTTDHRKNEPFSCDLCPKKFKLKWSLTVHKRTHAEDKRYQCQLCSRVLRSKRSLLSHRNRHLNGYDFCSVCQTGYVSKEAHVCLMANKGASGTSLVCDVCGRTCSDKYALKYHMLIHEEGYKENRKFKCEVCKKTFCRSKDLTLHFYRMHKNGGQKFVCDFCGKKLNSRTSLRDHLLIHRGVKPFNCPTCNKGFTKRDTLDSHVRTHTGDKPFVCKACGRPFAQRSSLTIHFRLHTGERPYVCTICHKGFVSSSLLTSHMKAKNHKS